MAQNNRLEEWLQSEKIKVIIFDFDGTLLDVSEPLDKALNEILTEEKITVDMDKTKKEIGAVLESVQGYPLPKIVLESYEIFKYITTLNHLKFLNKLKIAAKIFSRYLEYEKEASLFPEVNMVLEKLNKDFELFILSHNQTKNVMNHIEKNKIEKYFKGIYGADQLPVLKPNPDSLNPVLNQYNGLSRNKILMVGDMPTDIEAGQEAGIWTIGITSGISDRELLKDYHPDMLIDSLYELLDLFGIKYKKISESNTKTSLELKT